MKDRAPNLLGLRVGRLLVIARAESNSRGDAHWLCRCDCGREKVIHSNSLRAAKSHSCGCGRRKPGDVSCGHSLFLQYSVKARRDGTDFELTEEQALRLFRGDCAYCGVSPAQVFRRKNRTSAWQPEPFIYNGIDRVDSSQGYIRTNVVSCCGICNVAKNDMTLDEFESWIDRVHEHLHNRKRLTLVKNDA